MSLSGNRIYVVGFDPGTLKTGYAVMQVLQNSLQIVEFGVWHHVTPSKPPVSLGERLENLADHVEVLLQKYNPSCVGLECAVVFKNPLSALKLAEARGVIRLVAHQVLSDAHLRFFEISPTAVKKNISGFGMTAKKGIESSISRRFKLKVSTQVSVVSKPMESDAYDAVAVAYSAWSASKRKFILSQDAQNSKK